MKREKQLLKEDAIASLLGGGAGGAFGSLLSRVANDLKNFGGLLKAAARLLVIQVNEIISTVFGPTKTWEKYFQDKRQWDSLKKTALTEICNKAESIGGDSLDGKLMTLMLSPQAFYTSDAISGVLWPFSTEATEFYRSYGFTELPLIGEMLDDSAMTMSWLNLGGLGRDGKGGGSGGDGDQNLFNTLQSGGGFVSSWNIQGSNAKKLGANIQKIFVHVDSDVKPLGESVIKENKENKGENPLLMMDKKTQELFMKEVSAQMDKQWPIDRNKLIEAYQKPFDDNLDNITNVIKLASDLATFKDIEEFKKVLIQITKMIEMDYDINKLDKGFSEMKQKLLSDKKSLQSLSKEGLDINVLQSKDKKDPKIVKELERLDKRVNEIILNNFKGMFLQKLREELSDTLNKMIKNIEEGTTSEQRELLVKYPFGKKWVDLVQQNLEKINSSLQNLNKL